MNGFVNKEDSQPASAALPPRPAALPPANHFVVLEPKFINRQPIVLDRRVIAEVSLDGESFAIRTSGGRKLVFPAPRAISKDALREGLLEVLFEPSVLPAVRAIGEVSKRYIHPDQIESLSQAGPRALIALRGGQVIEIPTNSQQAFAGLVSVICGEEIGASFRVPWALPAQATALPERPTKQALHERAQAAEVEHYKASQPKPVQAGRPIRVDAGRMAFLADIDDALEKLRYSVDGFGQERVMENTAMREVFKRLSETADKLRPLAIGCLEQPDKFLARLDQVHSLVERFPKTGDEYMTTAHRLFASQYERFSTIRSLAKAAA